MGNNDPLRLVVVGVSFIVRFVPPWFLCLTLLAIRLGVEMSRRFFSLEVTLSRRLASLLEVGRAKCGVFGEGVWGVSLASTENVLLRGIGGPRGAISLC